MVFFPLLLLKIRLHMLNGCTFSCSSRFSYWIRLSLELQEPDGALGWHRASLQRTGRRAEGNAGEPSAKGKPRQAGRERGRRLCTLPGAAREAGKLKDTGVRPAGGRKATSGKELEWEESKSGTGQKK